MKKALDILGGGGDAEPDPNDPNEGAEGESEGGGSAFMGASDADMEEMEKLPPREGSLYQTPTLFLYFDAMSKLTEIAYRGEMISEKDKGFKDAQTFLQQIKQAQAGMQQPEQEGLPAGPGGMSAGPGGAMGAPPPGPPQPQMMG